MAADEPPIDSPRECEVRGCTEDGTIWIPPYERWVCEDHGARIALRIAMGTVGRIYGDR